MTEQDLSDRRTVGGQDLIKELSDLKYAIDQSAIVAMTDQTGRINYANDKFCDISGYSREELIGEDHRIINSGYHPKEFIRCIWTTIAKGEIWRGELRNRAKDGSIYWVDTTIVPLIDEQKKPFQYVAIRYEITERKLAEDRIRQQASLLDKAQDAIIVCDLNHQVLYWNQGAERVYGWSEEDAFGRNIADLLSGGDRRELEKVHQVLEAADEWKAESRHTTRSGERIIVESRWTLVKNDAGEPDYYLIINTDITEKKRTEEHLLRAQRMESIGTLAGGIAHDLNNILSPIMMAADMMRTNPDGETTRWVGMIKENAERGADLIKQVLTFARGMAGERITVNLKHLIKEIVSVLKETLPRSIKLEYEIEPELWTISADPTQIHQVLMNVCLNARDAMPDGGTLTIQAGNVVIDDNYARMNIDARAGSYLLLTVTDSGTGMSTDVISRIFDPFFTTKDVGKGTGLGLATTMTIVKSHDGFINVYSEPTKGTKFSIYLPSAEEHAARTTTADGSRTARGNGEMILVVDDEESIREVAAATLAANGYRTVTAADGREAMDVYEANKDDIAAVLTDMAMPNMDGAAMIAELRKTDPKLNIIAMSGMIHENQTVDLQKLGVEKLLPKPFTAEKLLTTLAEVLS
ncbi:MAG TPA: PAS domain S-box protein [Pyrinomonadaceae bacterium]|nr:PAS domain S-box protein [Pyrinomonadaceae bacterium]